MCILYREGFTPEKRDTEKGGLEAWAGLLAGAHIAFLVEREALGTSPFKQDFRQGSSSYHSLLF